MMADLGSLGGSELLAAKSALSADAEDYGNKPDVEMHWAMKAYHHAEVYFNLLCSVDPTLLKLTKMDDEVYCLFKATFPEFKVDIVNEDDMKSKEGKERWRPFCEYFRGRVEDYNYATLLRVDSSDDYKEENCTIAPRIQFFAIEIARNKLGLNSDLRKKFKDRKPNLDS